MTLCFCTGSYAATGPAARDAASWRHRRTKTFVHAITFEQLFGLLSFLCCTWPIDDLIRFWSIIVVTLTYNFQGQIWYLLYLSQKWSDCHEITSKHIDWTLGLKCDHRLWPWSWPWPWIVKVKHWICYISAKNGPIATKRKASISIDLKASNLTISFGLGHDLDFFRSNMQFLISQARMFRLPWNEKQTCWLKFGPQMWPSVWPCPWAWPWIFKVKYGICYISTKNSDYHETKSKHIKWTTGLKCDQWVWPCSDLDLWIFRAKCDLDLWPYAWCWPRVFMVKFWNSFISELEGRLTLTKGGESRSFITMIVTIWWPRSG